ncbi:ABC transporter ATP-binding protein [Dongia sp.]|uniref:ABC transporter ATP-binding protein n=1 Tax=Dongia sp. TaxID=1977262 RepID=UPI0035B187B4
MSAASHLDLRDLTAGAGTALLDGFSASIERGTFYALVSPEPAVLRTTVDLIAGFARPRHGRILIDGKDLGLRAPGERGVMSVRPHLALFPHFDARANMAFPLEQRGHDRNEIANRLERLAEECGIGTALKGLLPSALSAEQQLRVALARAIGGEPEILLLERPLQILPSAARRGFLPELKRLHRQFGLTTLLATDDLTEAMALADGISVIVGGREIQRGKADELFSRPASATVARLAGPCNLLPVTIDMQETRTILRSPLLQSGGGELGRERCHPQLIDGPALLLVRPEVVRPFLGIRRFDMLADGTIADVMPHGTSAQIRVAIDGFAPGITAEIPLPSPFPLESGRRVTLGWNRADSYLLPAE